jgi:thiosulfate dehydrogenase (quinone) large subunit
MYTSAPVTQIPEPPLATTLFADTKTAWLWLLIRFYVGWEWLAAGWAKLWSSGWVGSESGQALKGYLTGALAKTAGAHPDVQGWYGAFLGGYVLNHPSLFSYLVTFGELLVGAALILGALTGIAAFFGAFMNMNYLLAGTVSTNPVLFLLELFLILAWRVAGWYGLDRWLLPRLGTPWQPGPIFNRRWYRYGHH